MAQERRSGHIIPESGVYRVTHAWAHAGAQIQLRLIKGRRFPGCPSCQEISFELAHSDEAFWRDRSAPGTRYRRHRRSARSQSSNKAVVARSRALVRFVGSGRWSAIIGAIVVAVRGLLALRGWRHKRGRRPCRSCFDIGSTLWWEPPSANSRAERFGRSAFLLQHGHSRAFSGSV